MKHHATRHALTNPVSVSTSINAFLRANTRTVCTKISMLTCCNKKIIYTYTTQYITLQCKSLRTNLYIFMKYKYVNFLHFSHLSPKYPFLHPSIHVPSVLRQCLIAIQWLLQRSLQWLPKNLRRQAVKKKHISGIWNSIDNMYNISFVSEIQILQRIKGLWGRGSLEERFLALYFDKITKY